VIYSMKVRGKFPREKKRKGKGRRRMDAATINEDARRGVEEKKPII